MAGAGEIALIWAHASATAPAGAGLGVRPGYNTGAADNTIGPWHYQANSGTAGANIANEQFQVLSLTPGLTYIFSTGVTNSENSTAYSSGSFFCHTLVVIAKATSVAASALVNVRQ